MAQKFPILQSGFTGFSDKYFAEGEVINDSFVDIVLDKNHLTQKNPYFYSREITELYKQAYTYPEMLRDFQFREDFLSVFYRCIGTVSFKQWIELQNEQPMYTPLHGQFLRETLEYLATGQRSTHVVLWMSLLEARRTDKSCYKEDFSRYFMERSNYGNIRSNNVADIIQLWLSYPDGLMDLMAFAFTIFGKRTLISDTSEHSRV